MTGLAEIRVHGKGNCVCLRPACRFLIHHETTALSIVSSLTMAVSIQKESLGQGHMAFTGSAKVPIRPDKTGNTVKFKR